MYELVNTSLPNGLIAGTHGFATVAMTKGVPDILRGRLEALCAYTHRTSVHDATYYQQNPVNWFHVVLPQGEHVVGRVAPSEFDYTGRTNRLARLRVFGASEMPGVGGAEILAKESRWFCQPWEGEPRYLDDDKNTCGRLRFLRPSEGASARAWEAVFGDKGSRYAQQVAWQIEKNLSSGGKPVYFKTSAAWDVSGEKLLQLFAEVINLLPLEMRASVTFSTYPVSLPGGTGCSLRGVYDRDKIFDVSSATQAWVDCENAKIVHSELLPTSGPAGIVGATARSGNRPVAAGSPSGVHSTPKITMQRVPAASGDPNAYRNLIASRKQGPDMFVVGIVGACLFVLLAAGIFFFWMMQRNKRQMQDSGAAAAVEAEARSLEDGKEQQGQAAKEKLDAQQKETLESGQKTVPEKAEHDAKVTREADDSAQKREKEKVQKQDNKAAEKTKETPVANVHKAPRYLDAKEFQRGKPKYDYDSLTRKCKEPFAAGDGCCVYFYSGGVVTNAPAGFKVNKNIPGSAPLRWGVGLERKENEMPRGRDDIVLWYNPCIKRVYIDWSGQAHQNEGGEQWFADSSKVNLSEKVFGPDPNFEKLWANSRGKTTRYLISWKLNDKRSKMPISTEQAKWTADDIVSEIQKSKLDEFDEKIDKAKSHREKLEKERDNALEELSKLQSETNDMLTVRRAYDQKQEEINVLKKQNPQDEEGKEKRRNEIQRLNQLQNNMLAEGSDKPTGKPVKGKKAYNNISDLKSKISKKTTDVDKQQKVVQDKSAELENAKAAEESANQDKKDFLEKCKSNISKMLFTVCVEDEASGENK